MIKGRLIVTQTKEFNCSELVVGIHGSEQTYFRIYESDSASVFCSKRPFIYKSFVLQSYPNNVAPAGTQEVEFEFRTPDWLPNSTIYTADHASSIFNIRYGIFAQLIPTSGKDFVDQKKTVSVFRGSQDIYLYQKPIIIPSNIDLSTGIDVRVGGLMGLGGSRSVT